MIKEKILKEIRKQYDLTMPEEFRCRKAINLTLAEVGKAIDSLPVSDSSKGDLCDGCIQKEELKQKLGIK